MDLRFGRLVMESTKMFDYCYHTHTARCGHAFGTDEEYVVNAIKNGVKVLGFTDHAMLPNIHEPGMRGDFSLLEDYISSINKLKEKYKDQITIYLGMEAEYSPCFKSYYQSLLKEGKMDYLIDGQHSFSEDGRHMISFYNRYWKEHPDEFLKTYESLIIEAIESGLYLYIAHPDIYLEWYGKWDEKSELVAKHIIETANKHEMPLEINMGRSRLGGYYPGKDLTYMKYPDKHFWALASKMNVKALFGVDAHAPWDFDEGKTPFDYFRNFQKQCGVTMLDGVAFQSKLKKKLEK